MSLNICLEKLPTSRIISGRSLLSCMRKKCRCNVQKLFQKRGASEQKEMHLTFLTSDGYIFSVFPLKGYSGVCLPPSRSSLQTDGIHSFSNLRNDCTITIHCSICLQQETAIKKQLTATNNAQSSTKLQQQFK